MLRCEAVTAHTWIRIPSFTIPMWHERKKLNKWAINFQANSLRRPTSAAHLNCWCFWCPNEHWRCYEKCARAPALLVPLTTLSFHLFTFFTTQLSRRMAWRRLGRMNNLIFFFFFLLTTTAGCALNTSNTFLWSAFVRAVRHVPFVFIRCGLDRNTFWTISDLFDGERWLLRRSHSSEQKHRIAYFVRTKSIKSNTSSECITPPECNRIGSL